MNIRDVKVFNSHTSFIGIHKNDSFHIHKDDVRNIVLKFPSFGKKSYVYSDKRIKLSCHTPSHTGYYKYPCLNIVSC